MTPPCGSLSLVFAVLAVVVVALVTFNMAFPTVVAVELTGSMVFIAGFLVLVEARRRRTR